MGSELYCSECGRRYAAEDLARFGTTVVCAECKPRFVQRIREGSQLSGAVRYGGFWKRVVAFVIDALILTALNVPVSMLLGGTVQPASSFNPLRAFGLTYLLSTAIAVIYFGYFVSQKAATPGKMVMKLKVVTATGARVGIGRAIARYFASLVSALVLCIGYLIVAFDSQKRGLHDYLCGTRVVES